jgi:hypothetical protein
MGRRAEEATPRSPAIPWGHLPLFITHLRLSLPRLYLPLLCFRLQVVAAISQVTGIQEVTTFSEKRAA